MNNSSRFHPKATSSVILLTALGLIGAIPAQAQETEVAIADISASSSLLTPTELGELSSPEILDEGSKLLVQDLMASEMGEVPVTPDESTAETIEPMYPDAIEPVYLNELDSDPMSQVTSVSQLRDVSPSDWAYEALRNLVERYGCLEGYPDRTFRGNRALTRYEFAAGLNSCLQRIETLLQTQRGDTVTQQDLETLERLLREFEAEIATLGTRVDGLEGRVAFLEENQFSTTTVLFGQAIVGFQGRNKDIDFDLFTSRLEDPDDNINVINNVQLSLLSQLSPRGILFTSFQAGDGNTGRTFSDTLGNYVRLGYEGDNNNDLELTDLNYRHLFGRRFALIAGPAGVNPVNVFRGVNRIQSAGSGPLSSFAQRNPVINVGNGRGGIGFDWQISGALSFQGVYSVSNPNETLNGGIFTGDDSETAIGAQLVVSPTDTIDLSIHYVNSYSPFGRLGTGIGDDNLALASIPTNTNAVGATLEWRVSPNFTVGGWGGYTTSDFKTVDGSVETFNWMAFLNLPDLFGEGNLAGFYVGQPPKIFDSDLPVGLNRPSFLSEADPTASAGGQPDSTLHLEAFYRWQVSDNISVTPGVIVILNPLHNDDNDTITIGALRTTFTF